MELTIVVPFYNGHATLTRLLDTLPSELPVVIVDDHSDEPLQLDREGVTVLRPPEKGFFSGAVNAGVQSVHTDVLILNQDVWFEVVIRKRFAVSLSYCQISPWSSAMPWPRKSESP